MTGVRPTAIAYVSGQTKRALDHRCRVVTNHAAAEGLALEHIVRDRFEAVTIDQLVTHALARGASVLLMPAGTRLAEAQTRLTHDLEPHGAVCVVIGQRPRPAAPQRADRLADTPLASARRCRREHYPTPWT